MNISALIIGIFGLVAWLEPKLGFFVSYLAVFLTYLARRKSPSGIQIVSAVIGVSGFALSLIHLILSVTLLK